MDNLLVIPMDIILSDILPKLPAKSLLRFKCVSKTFLAEISSPKFIKKQHLNALSSDADRLLLLFGWGTGGWEKQINDTTTYMYDLDALQVPPSVCPFPVCIKVVASCECYLLIVCGFDETLALNNPLTRTYRVLPKLRRPDGGLSFLIQYGFCHCFDELDDDDDDYKVVRFVRGEVMVYSLRTNLWKLAESPIVDDFMRPDLFSAVLLQKHQFHMILCESIELLYYRARRIGCFDMKSEQWGDDVPFPGEFSDVFDVEDIKPFDLGVLDDKLCLVVLNMEKSTYDLWVMKAYGVKDSWAKLMCLPVPNAHPGPMYELLPKMAYHPLALRKGSPHDLLYKQDRKFKLFWYNFEDKESTEAEFPGLPGHGSSMACVCKGTLLNFPGGNRIRTPPVKPKERKYFFWTLQDYLV